MKNWYKKINLLIDKSRASKFKTLEEMAKKSKNMADLEGWKKIPDVHVKFGIFSKGW